MLRKDLMQCRLPNRWEALEANFDMVCPGEVVVIAKPRSLKDNFLWWLNVKIERSLPVNIFVERE